jgi:hypothetical protein
MPIRSYLEDSAAFDAEHTAALSEAFVTTCNVLRIGAENAHAREAVAVRIIELARSGVVDAKALSDRVIQEAGEAL